MKVLYKYVNLVLRFCEMFFYDDQYIKLSFIKSAIVEQLLVEQIICIEKCKYLWRRLLVRR